MNNLRPKNSVNVNIAIHMPNPPKTLKSTGLTIDKSHFDGDEEDYAEDTRGPGKIRLHDVVEISSAARKLAEKRNK